GGGSWTASRSSFSGLDLVGLACPSTTICLAVGSTYGAGGTIAAVLETSDAGRRWQPLPVPGLLATVADGFVAGEVPTYDAISCSSATRCAVLGTGGNLESLALRPMPVAHLR
ncbi:MAG TPA: hypothetical protein VMD59_12310, partial [Acidimicrobiales bacterium]|nr:hypothetical protein [Acidimicrobiales bacterium]